MGVKFYETSSGRSPVWRFLENCSAEIKADFVDALALLATGKVLAMPMSRNLFNIRLGLHELRLKDRSGIYRFLYFYKNRDGIYFLHAFKKKTQELPKKELEIVLKRLKEV